MGRRNETNRLAHKKKVDDKKKSIQEKKETAALKKKQILAQFNQNKQENE